MAGQKIPGLRIKIDENNFTSLFPFGALAQNVTMTDGSNLQQVIGSEVLQTTNLTLRGAINQIINKKVNLDQITINNQESNTQSSTSYSIGDYIRLNNILYRVKANIAANETFILDTNIQLVTVSDQLKKKVEYDNLQTVNDIDSVNATSLGGFNSNFFIIKGPLLPIQDVE